MGRLILVALALWPTVAWAHGWYLLIPPIESLSPPKVDTALPLRTWAPEGSYDTAAAREEARTKHLNEASQVLKASPKDELLQLAGLMWIFSRCVSSDDPRLSR